MPHELCDLAPRHRQGWHLLATHAEGLLECEGLLESPSSPRSSSYPAPKEALGSALLSQALGSQGRLGFGGRCSAPQSRLQGIAGTQHLCKPCHRVPKSPGRYLPAGCLCLEVNRLKTHREGIQELQGCGRIQAGGLL